jgi:hypothetical protein
VSPLGTYRRFAAAVLPGLVAAVAAATIGGVALVPATSSGTTHPYFTGPAGKNIVLPPRKGVLVGTAQSGASESVPAQIARLESQLGRRLDIEHRYMQRTCSLDVRVIRGAVRRGHIPMISWFPDPAWGSNILRGDADACIRRVGRQIARQRHRLLLRPYWEFNGHWMPWSKHSDGALLTTEEFKQLWIRTIDRLREGGAFPKVGGLVSVRRLLQQAERLARRPRVVPG